MRGALLAHELVLGSKAQVALGDLLQARLGVYRPLGETVDKLRREVRGKRVEHEPARVLVAGVEVEGAHDGLVDVLEGGVHAARVRALLGLANHDERGYPKVARHL